MQRKTKRRLRSGSILDVNSCPIISAAKLIFLVSRTTVERWIREDGAPQNENGTINLGAFLKWHDEKLKNKRGDERKDLFKEKLEAEIEKLNLQNEKIKESTIDRSLHEQILISQASTLRRYLEQTLQMNIPHFANRNVDELRGLFYDLCKEMMDVFTQAK